MILEGASVSQQKAFESAMQGKNLFITGEAGSGKSWLIQRIIEEKKKKGQKIVPEAPTGIAAIELDGGTTMHRTHGIPIDLVECVSQTPIPTRVLAYADVIIIDEISMARIDVFDYAMKTIEKLGRKIQVIVVGDFCQLPPVVRSEDKEMYEMIMDRPMGKGYCFQSEYWKKMKFEVHYLKEAQRQTEKDFLNALNEARYGDVNCIGYFNKRFGIEQDEDRQYIYLTGQNRKADEKNTIELEKLETREYTIPTEITGKVSQGEMRVPYVLDLKVGARVMILINDKDGAYSNGTIGAVENIDLFRQEIRIRVSQGYSVVVNPHTWEINKYVVEDNELVKKVIGTYTNYPIRLAWAITIHKSQGQTFDSVILDPSCWEEGQLYVALSRVKTIDGLILTKPISPKSLKADSTVSNFYKEFRWNDTVPKDTGYMIQVNSKKSCIIVKTPEETCLVKVKDMDDNIKGILPVKEDLLATKLVAQQLVEFDMKTISQETIEVISKAQKERAVFLAVIRKMKN